MSKVARVMVVDDHPMMREALSLRISSQIDLEVCCEAACVDEAMTRTKAANPDLAIIDIQLGDSHGLDLVKDIANRFPHIRMLVVSAFDESLFAERSLRAGAHGYINKRECQEKVLVAIRTVLAGKRYLSPEMTERLVGLAVGGKEAAPADPVQQLSDRELQIFNLVGRGMTSNAIAEQLHRSVHTVHTHLERIRHKLDFKNSHELKKCAIQWVLENG